MSSDVARPVARPARLGAELARAAGLVLAIVLPVLMVVANKSAPASLGLVAVLAIASVVILYGRTRLFVALSSTLRHEGARAVVAVVALTAVSFLWTIDARLTGRGLVEALPVLAFALACVACLPLVLQADSIRSMTVGFVVAALLIAFEARAGLPLHRLFGARALDFDLKRSAQPLTLLLWPLLAAHGARREWAFAGIAIVATLVGVAFAYSGAGYFGLAAGGLVYALALVVPRVALWMTAGAFALALACAPVAGTLTGRLMPTVVEQALADQNATHRILILRAFEGRVGDHGLLGHGFNTSYVVGRAPRPDGQPGDAQADRTMFDIHPHNVFLQIWVEFGLLGALVAAGVGAVVVRALARMTARERAPCLALFAAVQAIGLVELSAWQPWWLATIAAALAWFALPPRVSPR